MACPPSQQSRPSATPQFQRRRSRRRHQRRRLRRFLRRKRRNGCAVLLDGTLGLLAEPERPALQRPEFRGERLWAGPIVAALRALPLGRRLSPCLLRILRSKRPARHYQNGPVSSGRSGTINAARSDSVFLAGYTDGQVAPPISGPRRQRSPLFVCGGKSPPEQADARTTERGRSKEGRGLLETPRETLCYISRLDTQVEAVGRTPWGQILCRAAPGVQSCGFSPRSRHLTGGRHRNDQPIRLFWRL